MLCIHKKGSSIGTSIILRSSRVNYRCYPFSTHKPTRKIEVEGCFTKPSFRVNVDLPENLSIDGTKRFVGHHLTKSLHARCPELGPVELELDEERTFPEGTYTLVL